MRSSYKKIGRYVQQANSRNKDMTVTNLRGININKLFMPSVANTIGVDLSKYKIVSKHQFAFNPMHVGRDQMLPISMLESDEPVIVSPAYVVFEIKNQEELDPEYLMMWCRRPEFDRNAWFTTDSSVRGGFSWLDFCEMEFPVPTIEKQREIVREYNTIVNRIQLNEQLNQKLEETAQAIYKHWFVDFEFPISAEYAASIGKPEMEGKPYKYSSGEMVFCDKAGRHIPLNWSISTLGKETGYRKGYAFKSSLYRNEGVPVVRVSNFTKNSIDVSECNFINNDVANTYKAYEIEQGDIIVSTVGSWPNNPDSIVGKVVRVPSHADGALLNQNTVRLRHSNAIFQPYIYYSLAQEEFSSHIISGAQGSANQASVTLDHMFSFPIALPCTEMKDNILAFNVISSPIDTLKKEIHYLKKLEAIILSKISLLNYKKREAACNSPKHP